MPFDIENCVKYNANYLKGFTSERRDTNIDELKKIVTIQAKDITRFAANDTLKQYDRGVAWKSETLDVKGEQWLSAYLPIWLYSYQQVSGNKKILHYVAVNARTKETMGSVPIHMPKLVGISVIVEILGIIAMLFVDFDYSWLFLFAGVIYFAIMYAKYRNSNARHTYEIDTKKQMSHLIKKDQLIRSKKGLTDPMMIGANNKRVSGKNGSDGILDTLTNENVGKALVNTAVSGSVIASFLYDKEKK